MDKSKVFFTPLTEQDSDNDIRAKIAALWDKAGFAATIAQGDYVALKPHFGEEGNHNYVKAPLLMPLVEKIRTAGGKPFWTETSTLYVGRRANAIDHMLLAHEHGFGIEATGIPTIFADGLTGRDEFKVAVKGRHAHEVRIAQGIAEANVLVLVTHATGHLACGYGGAIKNLGMGLSSRRGKLYQHSVVKPFVKQKACKSCETCIKWCPTGAIAMSAGKAVIDEKKCIGCGECLAACRPGAIRFQWKIESTLLQERMAEQAMGVVASKRGKMACMTFIMDVGRDCDCLESREKDVLIKRLGIAASTDPVALDLAAIRLIEERLGSPLRSKAYDIDFMPQIKYAAELGMGSTDFQPIS